MIDDFDTFLSDIRRYYGALRPRPLSLDETVPGHIVRGIQRVAAHLVPEGSYGPDLGALNVSVHGYDKATITKASTCRIALPSGEIITITVESSIP